jgi:hypothetical protein
MRLLERDKQPVWVLPREGDNAFTPLMLRCIVSPRPSDASQNPFGVSIDFNVMLTVEAQAAKGKGIRQDSEFWIGRGESKPDLDYNTPTHSVAAITVSADNSTAFVALISQGHYNPLA